MIKSDELELAEKIERLKNERLFAKTIRDGIRLVYSLREGRADLLFAMFDWLQDHLVSREDYDALQRENDHLRGAIETYQQLATQRQTQNGNGGHE